MTTNMNFNSQWMREGVPSLDPTRLRRSDMFAADSSNTQPSTMHSFVDTPSSASKSIYFGQSQTPLHGHGDLNGSSPYGHYNMMPHFNPRAEQGSALIPHSTSQDQPRGNYDLQQQMYWGNTDRESVGTFDRYGVFSLSGQEEILEPAVSDVVSITGEKSDAMWYYLDPSGKEQGPFDAEEMYTWFKAGYFDPNFIEVRHKASREPELLLTLLKRAKGDENPFLISNISNKHPSARAVPNFGHPGYGPASQYPYHPPSYMWNDPWRNGMMYPNPAMIPQQQQQQHQQQQQQHQQQQQQQQQQQHMYPQQRLYMVQQPFVTPPMMPHQMMDAFGNPDTVARKNGQGNEIPTPSSITKDLDPSQVPVELLSTTPLHTSQVVLDITQTLSDTKLADEPLEEIHKAADLESPPIPSNEAGKESHDWNEKEQEETVKEDSWTDGWRQQTPTPQIPSLKDILEEEAKTASTEKETKTESEEIPVADANEWPVDEPAAAKAEGAIESALNVGGSAWATTLTPTLTLREIQEEEEKEAAKVQKSVSVEKRETKSAVSSVGKNPGGWSAVAASNRPVKDPQSTAAGRSGARQAAIQPNVWDTPKKNASLAPATAAAAAAASVATTTTTTLRTATNKQNKSTSVSGRAKEPSQEFCRWCKQELRDLTQDVNGAELLKILLSLPVETDSADIIQDIVYAHSTSMDGRRFAAEFIKRRKADMAGEFSATATTNSHDDASFQIVTKKGKRKH